MDGAIYVWLSLRIANCNYSLACLRHVSEISNLKVTYYLEQVELASTFEPPLAYSTLLTLQTSRSSNLKFTKTRIM